MANEPEQNTGLKKTVVRICPACGGVNPAGPSEACPHHQLVRFEGIDDDLSAQIEKLAKVRNQFWSMVSQLRATVMHAAQTGRATVEVTHKGRVSDVDALRKAPTLPFQLSNPEPEVTPKAKPPVRRKQKKSSPPKPVDPRQLALIAREPPQGDA